MMGSILNPSGGFNVVIQRRQSRHNIMLATIYMFDSIRTHSASQRAAYTL